MELFKYLARAWDVQTQSFSLREHMLDIQVKEIYFLTGLLRRGAPISLSCSRRGGETIKDYIAANCRPRSEPTKDGKIEIKDVVCLPLRTILFIISRFSGSTTFHLTNRSQIKYALECIEPKKLVAAMEYQQT